MFVETIFVTTRFATPLTKEPFLAQMYTMNMESKIGQCSEALMTQITREGVSDIVWQMNCIMYCQCVQCCITFWALGTYEWSFVVLVLHTHMRMEYSFVIENNVTQQTPVNIKEKMDIKIIFG